MDILNNLKCLSDEGWVTVWFDEEKLSAPGLSIFDGRFPVYYTIIFIILAFILGAVIGSFLNVVIIRVPRHEPISGTHNRSHCMSCGTQLKNIDLIPIFSYIFLRGKCRFCKAKISPRYWIVELTTAISFTLSLIVLGLAPTLPVAFVLIGALIVASGIDIDKMEIPYGCSLTVAGLGVIATVVSAITYDPNVTGTIFNMPWYDHLIGAVAVSVPFAILALFGAMGGGDVQLMAGSGLLLGWKYIIPAAAIGIIIGAIGGGIELLTVPKGTKKRAAEKATEVIKEWYSEQIENGVSVAEGKEDVIYGCIFKGKADIETDCIDEKLWSEKPDIAALRDMLDAELSDISKFAVSAVMTDKEVKKVICKRQVVFGPYLSVGILAGMLFGEKIISWYISFM